MGSFPIGNEKVSVLQEMGEYNPLFELAVKAISTSLDSGEILEKSLRFLAFFLFVSIMKDCK